MDISSYFGEKIFRLCVQEITSKGDLIIPGSNSALNGKTKSGKSSLKSFKKWHKCLNETAKNKHIKHFK